MFVCINGVYYGLEFLFPKDLRPTRAAHYYFIVLIISNGEESENDNYASVIGLLKILKHLRLV